MRIFTALAIAVVLVPAALRAQPAAPLTMKEAWRVEAGPSGFRAPRAIAVLGGCQVWIADAEAGAWRMTCDGRSPQVVGARGRAPGEFQQPWELAAIGSDSVAVFDRDLKRISVYSAAGAFGWIRDMPVTEASVGQTSAMSYAAGTFRFWTSQFPHITDPGALRSLVLSLAGTAAKADTLATFAGVPSIYWGSGFGGSRIAVPHQRRPYIAFLPNGGFIAGMNDSARVVMHDAAVREVRRFALDRLPLQRVTKVDRDAYADSIRAATEKDMAALHYNPPERAQYRAQIDTYLKEDVTFPEFRQLYDKLVIDAAGESLWVLLSGTGRSYARTWNVYAVANGAFQRSVLVPHTGAVVAVAVRDGALYSVERPFGSQARVAKYTQP